MIFDRLHIFQHQAEEQKERIDAYCCWFPYPVLIAFGLCLVLTGLVLGTLNQRRGLVGYLPIVEAEAERNGSIWLAITYKDDELIVTTENRKSFRLPRKLTSANSTVELEEHLKTLAKQRITKAALARKIGANEITVVLAVDETLRYAHVRPLIRAIANAGITDYAFETRRLNIATETSVGQPANHHL